MSTTTTHVLIADPVDERCAEIFRNEGYTVDQHTKLGEAELVRRIPEYDVLIVRSQTQVTAPVIAAATRLKVIGRAGAGVDNIDVTAATRQGIIVMNTPGGNTISTAEHTISMMLALARNIPQANHSLHEGEWERKKYVGIELYEKTLGILGLGKVGREVAVRCAAFGMKIIAFDPMLAPDAARALHIELVDVPELLRRSDIITVHTPLTNETRDLLNAASLATCKRGVRIVNCARGGIINEAALLDALNSGQVGGAALDVFNVEPPGDVPLLRHPHLIATPHLGASTEEAQEKVAIQIAHQVCDLLQRRGVSGGVNADALQAALRSELRPYLDLAEKLGALTGHFTSGKGSPITVRSQGAVLQEAASAVRAAFLKGMLGVHLTDQLNYVNAPAIAHERGLVVDVHHTAEGEYSVATLTAICQTEQGERTFTGTVYGGRHLRLTMIDRFHCEVNPEGNLLFYSNIDKPGVIAAVSSILAKAGINIAGMSLGRYGIGEAAVTVMNVDSAIPDDVVRAIAAVPGLLDVRTVLL